MMSHVSRRLLPSISKSCYHRLFAPNTTFFSTAPPRPQQTLELFELPSNLKIDPRVKCSPVYGAERVPKTKRSAPSDITDDKEDPDDTDILYNLSTLSHHTSLSNPHREPQNLVATIHDISTAASIGTLPLSPLTFGLSPIRIDILHRCVVYQRNKKRGKRNAGAVTKTISQVSGSGRKVRRQKGLGAARAGHSRPAHWRGGAKAHGPKGAIQDYTTKLNKKVRRLGMRHCLSQKLLEGNLVIVGDLNIDTHKTRRLEEMLKRFHVGKRGSSALFIDDVDSNSITSEENGGEQNQDTASSYGGLNVNFKVASANLARVKVLNQLGCNVYDMLKFEKLFLSLGAVRALEERLERNL